MTKPKPGVHLEPKLQAWHEAIQKLFPSNKDKVAVISTDLSCAMDIIEFLGHVQDFIEIPTTVKYRMTILLSHYMGLVKAAKGEAMDVGSATFPYVKDFTDEIMMKRMAYVVKILHDECERMGLYE